MKLPEAKQLPSGKWRVQLQVGGDRVSITADTQKEVVAKAASIKAGMMQKLKSPLSMTVGEAIDNYIESKDAILSPATIKGYKNIRKNCFQDIIKMRLSTITQERIQRSVNAMARNRSPKSVRNAHGLLSAAMSMYHPSLVLRTTMPQKRKYEASIPELDELALILEKSAGTEMELPILLAVWLGLRASEIRGLTWSCVTPTHIRIKQAIVEGEDGPALKDPKTYSGDRTIKLPDHIRQIIERQPKTDEYIVHLSGQAMYKRFTRLCANLDLPHFRFHDLRHASASIVMSLGVPNTYTQKRMGHKTDNMLKTVYLHTIQSKEDEYADTIDEAFEAIMSKAMPQNQPAEE